MAKRRTRKEKEKAKHTFTVHWDPTSDSISEASVKREFDGKSKLASKKVPKNKIANLTAKDMGLRLVRKDIFKSLILASIILASEIMIYLVWY